MIDGSQRVEIADVEVLEDTGLVLQCRIYGEIVALAPYWLLPGTEIKRPGDRGRLVLSLDIAEILDLAPRSRG